ncbi:MAG: ABC transporter permease [Acidobacteriota bacterium]
MIWNAFLLAIREVRRNLMRSSLTMLGIVIGVAAVIIMVTLGQGATASVTKQISSLGSNLLMVNPGQMMGPQQGSAPPFDVSDATAIATGINSVRAVAPLASSSQSAIYGNANWSTGVQGTDNAFFEVREWDLTSGRQFTESELRSGRAVVILGETVRDKLFGKGDPVGKTIRLEKLACQVIGLLESKGQNSMGQDQDDIVVIPLRTFQRRISGNSDVRMIQVAVRDGASTERVKKEIEELLRVRRHISGTKEDNFRVMDLKEISTMLTGTTTLLTGLLGAVAGVSLLVGGIGIMNIMLVSVTERTREIGVRLAIGALEKEVLTQFLVEAMVLSSLGGLVGIVIAISASLWLAGVLNVAFIFDPKMAILAFVFSASVGMVFGFFPARKAARLDPIEALRHE